MQAAAVQFYRLHAAIIQQTGNANTWFRKYHERKYLAESHLFTVHHPSCCCEVKLPDWGGFLVKSEPIEQRGGAATLECPLRPLPSGDPDEQNHHYKHAGHHKEEQPLEARRLGSQRVDLRRS